MNEIEPRPVKDFNFLQCTECSAVVSPEGWGVHRDWHRALNELIAHAGEWKPEPVIG